MQLKIWQILLVAVLWGNLAAAQQESRRDLEERRKQILRTIKKKSSQLEATQKTKIVKQQQKEQLFQAVKKQTQAIGSLQTAVQQLSKSIYRNAEVSESLVRDFRHLTAEYATRARSALREKLNAVPSLLTPQATNFLTNRTVKTHQRRQYFDQYDRFRQKEVQFVAATHTMLVAKMARREGQKDSKDDELYAKEAQKEQLHGELVQTNTQIKALSADEQRLRKELGEQTKNHERLNAAIEMVIRAEMNNRRAARTLGRNKNTKVPVGEETETPLLETPEFRAVSDDFRSNRGRLPWPVQNGVVSRRFGIQPHPELKNVKIRNNGVDIATEASATARTVCKGKVVSSQFIPGLNNMVVVQHGNYYTVYSNLEQVQVRCGDELQAKQSIGKVAAPKLGTTQSQLHFEVWKEKDRLNPAEWIGQ